jgi:hypothetical protein
MWNYAEGINKQEVGKKVKSELEALKESICEIIEIKVHINELSSSNMDILLDSLFENEETMAAYKIHPEHIRVSDYICSVLQNRTVVDYYEQQDDKR